MAHLPQLLADGGNLTGPLRGFGEGVVDVGHVGADGGHRLTLFAGNAGDLQIDGSGTLYLGGDLFQRCAYPLRLGPRVRPLPMVVTAPAAPLCSWSINCWISVVAP